MGKSSISMPIFNSFKCIFTRPGMSLDVKGWQNDVPQSQLKVGTMLAEFSPSIGDLAFNHCWLVVESFCPETRQHVVRKNFLGN
jgi:hypothetical protein